MSYTRELEILEESILAAGAAVARIANEGYETQDKTDEADTSAWDPVTCADLEADNLLREALLAAFPDDGWLSEETRDDLSRLDKKRVWIVDPVDGTREFVANIPEYGVSVALVEDHQPVLGAVYNPATEELVMGARGQGVTLNGEPVSSPPPGEKLRILASRSETKKGLFEPLAADAELQIMGSIAYKLALVAAGKWDSVISLVPKNEWDIAAGVILITEAGGKVTDRDGAEIPFNQEKTLCNGIVAASGDAYTPAFALNQRAP